MTNRIAAVAVLVCAGGCVHPQETPLALAGRYLWAQQAEDGGWHSRTYGLLRSGQSLTPFVLGALLASHSVAGHDAEVDRAIAFIRKNTRADGALGLADSIPDYPNYSTALAISAIAEARRPGWDSQVRPMIDYLRSQQFIEHNGWHPKDPVYGAWGMGGDRRSPPDTGHVDLSMTRHVLEAFRAAGVPASDPAFAAARIFVERCQNYDPDHPNDADGGFFFSTTEFDTNKAGHDGQHFRSYGTTTADGILALLITGAKPGDPRVAAAHKWLAAHHRDMYVPGFVGEAFQRWPKGLMFYYASSATAAFQALGAGPASGIAEGLTKTQRPDGSWSNPENLVKEDDPLIATPFAIRALSLQP